MEGSGERNDGVKKEEKEIESSTETDVQRGKKRRESREEREKGAKEGKERDMEGKIQKGKRYEAKNLSKTRCKNKINNWTFEASNPASLVVIS